MDTAGTINDMQTINTTQPVITSTNPMKRGQQNNVPQSVGMTQPVETVKTVKEFMFYRQTQTVSSAPQRMKERWLYECKLCEKTTRPYSVWKYGLMEYHLISKHHITQAGAKASAGDTLAYLTLLQQDIKFKQLEVANIKRQNTGLMNRIAELENGSFIEAIDQDTLVKQLGQMASKKYRQTVQPSTTVEPSAPVITPPITKHRAFRKMQQQSRQYKQSVEQLPATVPDSLLADPQYQLAVMDNLQAQLDEIKRLEAQVKLQESMKSVELQPPDLTTTSTVEPQSTVEHTAPVEMQAPVVKVYEQDGRVIQFSGGLSDESEDMNNLF
jgi:hypothetical protein